MYRQLHQKVTRKYNVNQMQSMNNWNTCGHMETPANRKRQKQTQRERDRHTERARQKSKSETETERLREKQRETERNKVGYRGNNTHTHVHTHARNNTHTHTHILVSINKIIPFWLEIKQFGGKETKHSHTFPHTFCNKIKITSNQIIRLFENKRNHIHNYAYLAAET